MWLYEKKLEYPVKIKNPNPALARVITSQLAGPDGELGAATRYLQQRYSMPHAQVKGMLTDIGISVSILRTDGTIAFSSFIGYTKAIGGAST